MFRPSRAGIRAAESSLRGPVGVPLGIGWIAWEFIAKLWEHLALSWIAEHLRDQKGLVDFLRWTVAHPVWFLGVLVVTYLAIVCLKAMFGGEQKEPAPLAAGPKQYVSGVQARTVQIAEVGGDLIQGDVHYHERPSPATQPHIELIVSNASRYSFPHNGLTPMGNGLVEVQSALSITFSALNTSDCQASLDEYWLEIRMPSGERLSCDEITNSQVLSVTAIPDPPGIPRLEPNAPLIRGMTLTRFARFLVKETVAVPQDEIDGIARGTMFDYRLGQAVAKYREAQGAFERVGSLCLRVVDSYGSAWQSEWRSNN
jgi:hypothetical protein